MSQVNRRPGRPCGYRRPVVDDRAGAGGTDGDAENTGEATDPGEGTPVSVARAAWLVATEGVALIVLGLALLVGGLFLGSPDSVTRALAEVLLAIVAGVAVLGLARGLGQVAGWSRAPVIVTQILAAPIGYSLAFPSGQPLIGVPILIVVAAVLYLLFTRESRLAFFDR